MSKSIKACSSTPNERTDSNESTSQLMIRTYNSISLQDKDLYEGRIQLYSFIQRNFLHEYKIIRNQPTEDASNSSRDATQQDVQQRNKFTGPEGFGGIGRAGGPDAYISTRIGKSTGISLLTKAPQRLGRAGGPGIIVSAGGADEDTSSCSTSSLGIGRAGSPGSLVSAGGADEDTSSFSTSSLGKGKAGGPGSLFSAGGAGENASSVFTTNSSGIGRAGGPVCLVSVDGVVVSNDDVSHGRGWAGGPGDHLYIVSTGNKDNSSETVHQFNKDENRERKCHFNAYGAATKGRHRKRKFPRSSSLNSLSPFFDEENKVIRVGGRLANSPYTIDRKFPVLIPRKSPITEMLIREAHEKNLH